MKKSWSQAQVFEFIKQTFASKLQDTPFEICLPMGGYITKVHTAEQRELDGQMLSTIFSHKAIYIRPLQPLPLTREVANVQQEELDVEMPCNEENDNDNDTRGDGTTTNELEDEPDSLKGIINKLQNSIVECGSESTVFNICRDEIYKCALRALHRKSFNANNSITVCFMDTCNTSEGAVDAGGPKREMFRLLLKDLQYNNQLFEGPEHKKYLTFHKQGYTNNDYYDAGAIIALSIVHVGLGPRFFSELLFSLISNQKITITIDDILDPEVKSELKTAMEANTTEQLRTLVIESTFIRMAGWSSINDINLKDEMIKGE